MYCIAVEKENILFNMEDTVKIFVLGFKKWAKINKVNQTQIGRVVGKVQTTISDYWNGISRPSIEMINSWVDAFDLDYEEVLQAGRMELSIQNNSSLTESEIRRIIKEEQNQSTPYNITTERYIKIFEEFQQKDLALEITDILLEIERIDRIALKEARRMLRLLKRDAEEEILKNKQAAN